MNNEQLVEELKNIAEELRDITTDHSRHINRNNVQAVSQTLRLLADDLTNNDCR